jgi:hypothetical protein
VTLPAELTFQVGENTAQMTCSGEGQCTTTLTFTGGTADRLELSLVEARSCTPGTVTVQSRSDGGPDYVFTSESGEYASQATLTRAWREFRPAPCEVAVHR